MSTTTTTSSTTTDTGIVQIQPLPTTGPFPTLDPFLFCVYHKDHYPKAANENMEAPKRGNGMDFDASAPYRMYHGERVPGFPQHPHRGFETITATITGLIDHADSVGNAGRYGHGDVQWMTAGQGICHSEMFPLLQTDRDNPLRFFQIWLNLPAASKLVDPSFAMFWAHRVPRYQVAEEHGSAFVTLWAGRDYWNAGNNNAPPPDSWAANPDNDVAIWHVVLPKPGDAVTLPAAHFGAAIHRSLFYIEGDRHAVTLNGTPLDSRVVAQVHADRALVLQRSDEKDGSATAAAVELLLLQGRPIGEPVAQRGPFVMNTAAEIQQAFCDYRDTEFGGWPWPRDDMVFDRTKARFALQDGRETTPEEDNGGVCATDQY